MKRWRELFDKYVNFDNIKNLSKTYKAIIITILIYLLCSRIFDVWTPTWLPIDVKKFFQIDVSGILSSLMELTINFLILGALCLLVVTFLQIKEPFIRKISFINGCPMWICYKFSASPKDSSITLRNLLDKVFSSYKKKRLMILGEFPECFIVYGSANKTALDTSGKRKDATLKEHLQIKLKNVGTQCVKFCIENIKIDGDYIEIVNPSNFFLCDLSKEKQEYIISINEVCANEKDFESKFIIPEKETVLLLDIISYDLFQNKYLQTLNFSKKASKWEFFIIDSKQI